MAALIFSSVDLRPSDFVPVLRAADSLGGGSYRPALVVHSADNDLAAVPPSMPAAMRFATANNHSALDARLALCFHILAPRPGASESGR